jgi:glycerophosphoryl diester phosphodiesterase
VCKSLIVPRDASGRSQAPTQLIDDAHKVGLKVHAWTFRAENAFLPTELQAKGGPEVHGDLTAELKQFYTLGIDAAFSDYPAIAVAARGE